MPCAGIVVRGSPRRSSAACTAGDLAQSTSQPRTAGTTFASLTGACWETGVQHAGLHRARARVAWCAGPRSQFAPLLHVLELPIEQAMAHLQGLALGLAAIPQAVRPWIGGMGTGANRGTVDRMQVYRSRPRPQPPGHHKCSSTVDLPHGETLHLTSQSTAMRTTRCRALHVMPCEAPHHGQRPHCSELHGRLVPRLVTTAPGQFQPVRARKRRHGRSALQRGQRQVPGQWCRRTNHLARTPGARRLRHLGGRLLPRLAFPQLSPEHAPATRLRPPFRVPRAPQGTLGRWIRSERREKR